MVRRLFMRIVMLAAALAAAVPLAAAQPPAAVHRIVAVGDLHGDVHAWRDIARAAGLIDAGGHWSGGATVLVQTGDMVDRGPDSLPIVDDLMRLQREAPRAGGRVVVLVGNHEAMNVTDDLRYVSAGDYAAFATPDSARVREEAFARNRDAITAAYRHADATMSAAAIREAWLAVTPLGAIEHQVAWHPDGRIGRWIVNNPAVLLLDGTLFVHGGISAGYASLPIARINALVAASLRARDTAPTAIINDPAGPLWYRGLITRDPTLDDSAAAAAPGRPSIDAELDAVLRAYDARRIVIAHTPILSGIAVTHDGKLARIDTGISAVFGGTPSYLEIVDGNLVAHVVARSK